MPTASERATIESERWSRLASDWARSRIPQVWEDRAPSESATTLFHDPTDDLESRCRRWGFGLSSPDLPGLALFAAALAATEADAWDRGIPDLATRALEARRFLLGDRMIHWAVPWLDTVGRDYPQLREMAHADRDFLLDLGDEYRVAPELPGREGLLVAGEDSFGPLQATNSPDWLRSVWSGILILDATLQSLDPGIRSDTGRPVDELVEAETLGLLYEASAARWRGTATNHPGSAQLWLDLAARADSTAAGLVGV